MFNTCSSLSMLMMKLLWLDLSLGQRGMPDRMKCERFGEGIGQVAVSQGRNCLLFTTNERSWDDTRTYCNNIGWSMVEKIDKPKHERIEESLFKHFKTEEFWIGLREVTGVSTGYRWASGKSFGSKDGWIGFVPVGEEPGPHEGECVAVAGAGRDRVGGGWRQRSCSQLLKGICEKETRDIANPVRPTTTMIETSSSSTARSSSMSTLKRTSDTNLVINRATKFINGISTTSTSKYPGNSTEVTGGNEANIQPYIFVIVGVLAGGFLVVIAGILVHKRTHKKIRQTEPVSTYDYIPVTVSGNVALNDYTTVNSEYEYAVTGSAPNSTHIRYDHIMLNKENSPSVSEQAYDTANVNQGRQLQPTFSSTYDRAMFNTLETTVDKNVYDHAKVTLMTSPEVDEKKLLLTYDHAFIQ